MLRVLGVSERFGLHDRTSSHWRFGLCSPEAVS
jgi:hypothetical protein